MSKDKRAAIVEAMASRIRTNKKEGYETTLSDKALCGERADIALKAAAEVARRFQCGECDIGGPAVANALLALTSEGVKKSCLSGSHPHLPDIGDDEWLR